MGGNEEERASLLSIVPSDRTRNKWAQTERHEIPSENKAGERENNFFHWKGGETGTGCPERL